MNRFIGLIGNIFGALGVLVCAAGGLLRVGGHYYVLGYETESLFMVGIALMVMACLVKLQQLAAAMGAP